LARALADAGYRVLGYDISSGMLEIARKRVPEGEFRLGSFLDAELPCASASLQSAKSFNYQFDSRNNERRLSGSSTALQRAPSTRLFIFDVATPGRVPGLERRSYTIGDDWACLFEAIEDPQRQCSLAPSRASQNRARLPARRRSASAAALRPT